MITVETDVAISDLIGSLNRLWEVAEDACEGITLTRSLTQNLILVTDSERLETMHELIDGLLDRHPCRAVIIVMHTEPCELKAKLSAQIRDRRRVRAMVLERLTIETDWEHFPKLPNLIRPLLVNDIATSLFWATKMPKSLGRIGAIASLVDHTIVDSTLFDGDDWRGLEQLSNHSPLDLAWLRVSPWRRTLAEAFEHFEWEAEDPETRITLVHGPSFGSLGASRCLESWLIEHLDAKVTLVREEGEGPPGEPWRLELQYGPIEVKVRHMLTEPRLQATVSLKEYCLLPTYTQATRGDRSQLLAAALDLAW